MGFSTLDVNGGLKIAQNTSVFTLTTTGTVDDLDFANADLIRFNNASLATLRGLKAGVDGQRVTIVSIGAGEVDCAHQNAGSVAANRLINFVTSGITPLAPGVGTATYQYDATTARWRLITHDQGALIAVPYASGNFLASAGTWTVDSGDQLTFAFYVDGNRVTLLIVLTTTSVSSTPADLTVAIPNSWTVAKINRAPFTYLDNGTAGVGMFSLGIGGTTIILFKDATGGVNWATATNNTAVYFNSFVFVN